MNAKLGVQFEDGIHGAFKEAREALLAFADRGFGAEAVEFGGGAVGENAEGGLEFGKEVEGFGVQRGQVPEDRAVGLEQRHAGIAHGIESHQVRIVGEEFNDAFGTVHQAAFFDHHLAGRPGNAVFVVVNELAVHPEGQGAQNFSFRQVLGDPNAGDVHGQGSGTHQGLQEFLSGVRRGAFEKMAYQGFRSSLHGSAVGTGHFWASEVVRILLQKRMMV